MIGGTFAAGREEHAFASACGLRSHHRWSRRCLSFALREVSGGTLANVPFEGDLPVESVGSKIDIAGPRRGAGVDVDTVEELDITEGLKHSREFARAQPNASAQPILEAKEEPVVGFCGGSLYTLYNGECVSHGTRQRTRRTRLSTMA